MSDQTAVWLMLGLMTVQLVTFTTSLMLWLASGRRKDAVAKERISYQSNFWSGAGFASMSALAFTCQQFVEPDMVWKTWASALFFMVFAVFLFWLGAARRRLLKLKQASSE